MPAHEVLTQLHSLGISVEARGDSLVVKPASLVPVELKGEIRQHKADILALLAPPPPAVDEGTARLLAWASRAAEDGLTLPEPVRFFEGPLRPHTTVQVGRYCRDQLRYLSMAKSNGAAGGWDRFPPQWWAELETTTIESLASIKAAVDGANDQGEST